MVKQYLEIKRAHPEGLLLFRMGDFYEMFFDDAIKASAALSIALTKRGRHQGDDIPMCGIPFHAADSYVDRLIRAGFKVAVCEQVEDPAEAKKRGPKAIVAREVLRVITHGTLTEETLLDARSHNYLVALGRVGSAFSLAWFDISTGDLCVSDVEVTTLAAEFARLHPGEILVADTLLEEPDLYELFG
ncbi:MAG: DNA mismatch repair protein MutS, partial [Proteobacteria bacterium]|nr:DNA mismatch repair protein MutS [Pseudomonadota bacterium]